MNSRKFILSFNVITYLAILFLISPFHIIKAEETWNYVFPSKYK